MNRTIESESTSVLPDRTQVVLALLAFVVAQMFRSTFFGSPLLQFVESSLCLVIPVIAFWLLRKRLERELLRGRNGHLFLAGFGGALYVLLLFGSQIGMRQFGFGDANEIVAITNAVNLAWYCAVFSGVFRFRRGIFLLCSFMVLFICFTTQAYSVYTASACYSVVALWWMLENYWKRFETRALDADSKSLPIRWTVTGVAMIALALIGSLATFIGPLRNTISLPGFMLSSGGTDGTSDMYARAGVGDGDQLTNGENATTVGAIETDQFIEDDKPSLYDIMSESYDGPKMKPAERSKAVSPDAIAKHLHDVKNSEQAGKSFRTHRKSSNREPRNLEERLSNALFYVEGPVPTRFAVDYFNCFDGWDWTKTELSPSDLRSPKIQLEIHESKPWYTLTFPPTAFLTGELHHKIKVMRLNAISLPSPPFLKAWHIDQVDREKFFQWNENGAIDLNGVQIPSLTVINSISKMPNFSELNPPKGPSSLDQVDSTSILSGWFGGDRETSTLLRNRGSRNSPFLELPENETKEEIQALANRWTSESGRGWSQVQAIVNAVRSNYRVDNTQTIDAETEDTVANFLKNGGGPTYMFATTAAQVLRAAGYQTRLASGFVVRKKDFVRTANQSVVGSENFHLWPEVRIDGTHWIPVEPTPGYPVPISHQSVWKKLTSSVAMAFSWLMRNPISMLAALALITLLIRGRKTLLSFVYWLIWLCLFFASTRWRLLATRRLLDVRLWAAGIPRPPFSTLSSWCNQINPNENREFFLHWNQEQFSSAAHSSTDRGHVERSCRNIVAEFSLKRIKNFVKQIDSIPQS